MTQSHVPTVLVVDDDEKLAGVLSRSLRRSGYECLTAASGDEALWSLAAHEADALVLDVMIPHPSGIEICRHLRARGYGGPIVMISASGHADARAAALRAGADSFLAKPFPLADLARALRSALEARTAV